MTENTKQIPDSNLISDFNPKDPQYTTVWNRHFICELFGIDSYLINSFSAPHMSLDCEGKLTSYGLPIQIGLIQTVDSKVYQNIYKQIKEAHYLSFAGHDLRLKQIDPFGNTVSITVYKNAKITSLTGLDSLSYDNPDMSKFIIGVTFSECIVEC